jgi:hypothetical protein
MDELLYRFSLRRRWGSPSGRCARLRAPRFEFACFALSGLATTTLTAEFEESSLYLLGDIA